METVKQIKHSNMNMLRTGIATIAIASSLSIAGCTTTTTEPIKCSNQQESKALSQIPYPPAPEPKIQYMHIMQIPVIAPPCYFHKFIIPPCNLRR